MRRKFLSVVLCVCMMLTMAPFAFAEGETESETPTPPSNSSGSGSGSGAVTAGITTEKALKDAISAASENETITLGGSITLTAPIIIKKKITLDMDGHTFSSTQDIWNDATSAWSFISVQANGDLTITGNGTFQTNANDCYAVDIQDATAKCTIENGTFVGNIHAIYVFEGSLFVNGGTYSIQQKYTNANQADEFVLNCYDANRRNGSATISVSGGSFINFNPANCQAEGIATNFCADGYTTTSTTNNGKTIYTVGTGTNSAVANAGANYNTLQSAINSVEANSSSTQTVTLLKDVTEDITIPSGKTITLDLNGHKIVNSSAAQNNTVADNLRKHTITNNGTLTIMDSVGTGVVDNVSHGRAALYNAGTISEIKGGKFTRSVDNSTDETSAKGNSWYVVYNAENATITKISAGDFLAIGHFSSLFSNCGTIGEISGGTFKQDGFIAFKNEGTITKISGGTFSSRDESCIQNWGTIGEICGGAITAGSIGIWNFSSDKYNSAGKVTNISGGEIKGTTAAIRLNDYDATYLEPATPSSKNKASATISGGKINGVLQVNTNTTLTITGGYFTSDPTAYLATGKAAVESDLAGYNYKVANKSNAPATVASAEPTVDTDGLSADQLEVATEIATKLDSNTVTGDGLTAAASTIANNNTVSTDDGKRALESKQITTGTDNTRIVVQTYMDIDITAVNTTSKTLTLDITPMYRTVATTANTDSEIRLTGADVPNANAVLVGPAGKLIINKPVTIKIPLPTNFVSPAITGANDYPSIYVQHKGYEYTATVSKESEESDTLYATFTNPHGFSTFTITTEKTAEATLNGVNYTSFQDAVNAANNGDVITALKDNLSATMSGSPRTITVKSSTGTFNVSVNGETKTADANTGVTFTYTRPSSGGPGSSGGSISTPTTYAVNVNAATNGAVAADKKTASKGTTVTVTASPSKGYVVDAVKVVDKDGKDVAVTEKDGKYVFTMPASAVTVTGSFKAETPAPVAMPFTDVKSSNWFYDAVKYAYAQGLMTGTSATTFAPNGTMNRAMIVTVLYRLEKSPAVTGASKFTDVPAGQWYSDAVAWAAANKIVNGYDETTFGPMNAVTREQMAAILFRYEQVKGLENVTLEENLNRFPDQNKISAYAIPALQWAVGQKIINGNADGTLDPTGTATRAQVAQIFTNLLNK